MDHIFIKLPNRDLISCSAVNRFWHSRARRLLHDHRVCLAQIAGQVPCDTLKIFNETLGNSYSNSILPFNGLSITVIKSHKCIRHKPVTLLFKNVFERLTLKYLKIYWAKDIPCPSVSYIKTLFKGYLDNLEKLEVLRLPYGEESLCEHFQIDPTANPHWLPKLKELKIPSRKSYREGNVERSQIFELISASPNLREIDGVILPFEVQFLLSKRKVDTVREFEFCYGPGMLDLLSDFSVAHPKLTKLYVANPIRIVLDWENEQAVVRALDSFLKDSADTLEELSVDGILFILQYHSQIPRLSNLKTLCGFEKARRGEFPYFAEAHKLNFAYTFPVLQSVEVDEGFLNLLVRFSDALYHGFENQYSSGTVTSLRLCGNYNDVRRGLEILAALFPNVKSFRKTRCSNLRGYFVHLPAIWPELEEMNFEEVSAAHWRALKLEDVCGIDPEEACELRTKEEHFLREYQYVPLKPSVGTMNSKFIENK